MWVSSISDIYYLQLLSQYPSFTVSVFWFALSRLLLDAITAVILINTVIIVAVVPCSCSTPTPTTNTTTTSTDTDTHTTAVVNTAAVPTSV